MSFNITPRESITRCEVYDNKFRFYPEETRLKETRLLLAKDRIEPESERLERQMTDKLSKGVFQPEGATTQYIKKVGKFVFVAVLNPPYYLAIKAPLWLLQQIGPPLGAFTGTLFGKLGAVFTAASEMMGLIAAQFSRLFNFRLKKSEKSRKSSRDFPFKKQFQTFFSALQKKIISALEPLERALERMGKIGSTWIQRLLSTLEKAALALRPYLPKISFKVPKIDLKRPLIQLLRKIPTREAVLERLKQAGVWALAALKELAVFKEIFWALVQFFGDILRTNYQQWIEPYFRWVGPLLRRIISPLKKLALAWVKGKRALSESLQWLFSKAALGLNYLRLTYFQAPLLKGIAFGVNAFSWIANKIQALFQALLSSFQNAGQKIGAIALNLKIGVLKGMKGLSRIPKKLFSALNTTADLMILGAQKLARALLKSYLFLKVFTKLFFKALYS